MNQVFKDSFGLCTGRRWNSSSWRLLGAMVHIFTGATDVSCLTLHLIRPLCLGWI